MNETERTFRHDRRIDHCREVVCRNIPANLPPECAAAVESFLTGGALSSFEEAVEEVAARLGLAEDPSSTPLNDLRESLFEHGRMCDCSEDEFDEFVRDIDELLATFGHRAWVVEGHTGDAGDMVYAGLRDTPLRISEIGDLESLNLIEIHINGSPGCVAVSVAGERSVFRAVPSGRDQLYLAAFILGHAAASYHAVNLPGGHVVLAEAYLAGRRARGEHLHSSDDVVPLAALYSLDVLTEPELEVALALAPSHEGTITELHGLAKGCLAV